MGLELSEIKSLDAIRSMMTQHNVNTLVFKRLAPNDNSKNQIYLGADYSSLQLLPFGKVYADKSKKDSKRDRFKADLPFFWMDDEGRLHKAPNAQLILYPKYPEVRMSGFLKGARVNPGAYLRSRDPGRILLLGITGDRRIIGHMVGRENPIARELEQYDSEAVFSEVFKKEAEQDTRKQLLTALKEISELGWVNSFKLGANGERVPYKAQNGGGYTLEGLLGVTPNGLNEPDFLGWEIKQHRSPGLDKPLSGGAVTLMTPEPTGGFYRTEGIFDFVRKFGYPDTKGREDRFNFGGVHKFGVLQARTGLTLQLTGYDIKKNQIDDINGGISLVSEDGVEAAIWHYGALLEKWNRKHAKAAYIPSASRKGEITQYKYGHVIALGVGTDFGKFLSAMASRIIYYDPGIKVEGFSSDKPKAKKRSQFRIKPKDIPVLYESMELVDLTTPDPNS